MKERIEQRYAHNFIAITIKPDEELKKTVLHLFAPLFKDKEKTAITTEDTTDHEGNAAWEIRLLIFDYVYASERAVELLELCKKAVRINSVLTLVARLRASDALYVASAGDYWSKKSKEIIDNFETEKFYHKEMIGKAPFYIIKQPIQNEP